MFLMKNLNSSGQMDVGRNPGEETSFNGGYLCNAGLPLVPTYARSRDRRDSMDSRPFLGIALPRYS